MENYRDLIKTIIDEGQVSGDRTGTGTKRIFGTKMEFDCTIDFPLVTIKKTHFDSIVHELLWFLRGDTNIKYLQDNGIKIWNEWADTKGEVGPMYGSQWRNANGTYRKKINGEWVSNGIDQLQNCIDLIKNNPTSRRIIVDCWNTRYLPDESISPRQNVGLGLMALAPCHMFFQFFVRKDFLDIQVYQRSVDAFLGLPFNIASYALLLELVATVTAKRTGKLIWLGGDTHLYNNHMEQATEMIQRKPLFLPYIDVATKDNINDFNFSDITLHDYNFHPPIKGAISV